MKISGFTMVKNAAKLYYPIKQSIMSVLPIVDEFIVALGDCDPDDKTKDEIKSINSDKIEIINTDWDIEKFPRGTENAHQTDIAKENCSGDWLFYLQADEVVHEKYLSLIKNRCEKFLPDNNVEGLLFAYLHFWGDFNHHQVAHGWYKNEIRIVRNDKDIHSWESAQSFRRIPDFDGKNYRQQEGTYKLKVAKSGAEVYHYGWVRPPELIRAKQKSLDTIHKGKEKVDNLYKNKPLAFDYGPLSKLKKFKGTHPKVMKEWIEKFNWEDKLNYSSRDNNPLREKWKQEKLNYRLISFIEQKLFGGQDLFGFKNYELLKGKKYSL